MNNIDTPAEFQSQTYAVSDTFIKKTKRLYLTIMIALPFGILFMLFFTLYLKDQFEPSNFLTFFLIGLIAFLELEIFIVSRIMLKKIKENTLTINRDFIQRKSKVLETPLEFKFIKKLAIKYNPNGSISYINVINSSQTIRLYGFENMEEIAQLLKSQLPHAQIKEHTYKFDYNSPATFIITFIACIILFSLSNNYLPISMSDIFAIGLGVWMLLGKPISKAQGDRFRIFEIICSILIIGGIAISYIGKFYN